MITIDDTYYCTLSSRMMAAASAAADVDVNLARNTHELQPRHDSSVSRHRHNEPREALL